MTWKIPGITQLPNGRTQVRVTATCPYTGQKHYRKKVVDSTSRANLAAIRVKMLNELKEELQKRRTQREHDEIITVADYAELWIRSRVSRLRRSVQENYLSVLADRVLPVLGERPIRQITRHDVQEWVIWAENQVKPASGKPYARDTLRAWWRPMVTMLRDAAAELDFTDPTLRVRPPNSPVRNIRERRTLTDEQLGQVVETAKRHWPDWYAEILTLAYTGMRPGELYALRWMDVDWEEDCIWVRRSVSKGYEGPTKTDSARQVGLPDNIREALMARSGELLDKFGSLNESDLVFPAETGGFRRTSALRKTLRLVGETLNLKLKLGPQVLRRSFNTSLVEAGVDQAVIRSQMGHTTPAMTERYAGVHVERKLQAVDRLIERSTNPRRNRRRTRK